MNEKRSYFALYPDYGGQPLGFRCGICPRVVRTQRGVRMHLLRVHGVREQLSFNFPAAEPVSVTVAQ